MGTLIGATPSTEGGRHFAALEERSAGILSSDCARKKKTFRGFSSKSEQKVWKEREKRESGGARLALQSADLLEHRVPLRAERLLLLGEVATARLLGLVDEVCRSLLGQLLVEARRRAPWTGRGQHSLLAAAGRAR